jgi:hypothetical protein
VFSSRNKASRSFSSPVIPAALLCLLFRRRDYEAVTLALSSVYVPPASALSCPEAGREPRFRLRRAADAGQLAGVTI